MLQYDNEGKWVIHKHVLQGVEDYFLAPKNTQILSAGQQEGEIVVWYLRPVEDEDIVSFKTLVVGTGHKKRENELLNFIGTVQVGPLVWHIFYSKD